MKTNIPSTPQQYNLLDVSQKVTNNVIGYCELTPETLRLSIAKLCLMGDDYTYTIKEIPYAKLLYGINEKEINYYMSNGKLTGEILFPVTVKLTAFIQEKVESRRSLVLWLDVSRKNINKTILTLYFMNSYWLK